MEAGCSIPTNSTSHWPEQPLSLIQAAFDEYVEMIMYNMYTRNHVCSVCMRMYMKSHAYLYNGAPAHSTGLPGWLRGRRRAHRRLQRGARGAVRAAQASENVVRLQGARTFQKVTLLQGEVRKTSRRSEGDSAKTLPILNLVWALPRL